jgi:hypothetical protein
MRGCAKFHLPARLVLRGPYLTDTLCRWAINPTGSEKALDMRPALDVGVGLLQAGIDAPAFSFRVFIGRGKAGAINHDRGRDDNLAALEGKLHQIALRQAGLAPGRYWSAKDSTN